MTDILTHALAFVAGAVPAMLWARGKMDSARISVRIALSELEAEKALTEALAKELRTLRAKQPARDAKGHFVSKRTNSKGAGRGQ